MASIELTLPVVVTGSGWLISMLVNVWVVSRKSQGWDSAEEHEKTLYGVPRDGKTGLVQRMQMTENTIAEQGRVLKYLLTGLEVHGSGEHQIVEGVKKKMREHAAHAVDDVARARKALIEEQTGRFHALEAAREEVVEEEDPFSRPSATPPERRRR